MFIIKLLRRLPALFWCLVFGAFGLFLVDINTFEFITTDKAAVLNTLLTFIALGYLAYQIQGQKREAAIANEYLNQPDFKIEDFNRDCRSNQHLETYERGFSPRTCGNPDCQDLHWFNVSTIGNLPIKNISLALFHESEAFNILRKDRWVSVDYASAKGLVSQYKLPKNSMPTKAFPQGKEGSLNLLLSYQSAYSNIRYKRYYEISFSTPGAVEQDWAQAINCYNTTLISNKDSYSLSFKEVLRSLWYRFNRFIKPRRNIDMEEWLLIDLV